MRTFRSAMILLTLCVPCFAQSQSGVPRQGATPAQGQQQSATSTDRSTTQRHYDPLAGHPHMQGGIWDNAFGKINTENKDLGQCVSEWRQVAVQGTIQTGVFWVAVVMDFSLLMMLLYVYWLLRDRTRRLDVSVTILTQISNAYLDARHHALEAIEKHNQLADDYNTLAEKMAATDQQKTENQKRVRREAKESIPEDFGGGRVTETEASSDRSAPPEVGAEFLLQQRRDADAQAGRRFAQQISALQEKNKTLRTSLNEALTENERLKREKVELKGA